MPLVAIAGVIMSAVFNLDGPGHYIHWSVVQISVANLILIGLMVVVFVLAVLVPFPRSRKGER